MTAHSATNLVIVQPNGPNVATGDLAIVTPTRVREMQSAVLCRCGHSADMPFCDGTHVKIGFSDAGRLRATYPGGVAGAGRLTVTPMANGPNRCEGPLTIRDIDRRICASDSTLLCRCGGSNNKPFCDGTHVKIGFKG
jgi:CDGSH-type Zn-finger protein